MYLAVFCAACSSVLSPKHPESPYALQTLGGRGCGLGSGMCIAAQAQSIDPASFSGTLAVGESVTIHKTITLAPGGADLVDLYMLADNTGSMGTTIGQAKRAPRRSWAPCRRIRSSASATTRVIAPRAASPPDAGKKSRPTTAPERRRRCRATCRPLRPASTDGPPGTAGISRGRLRRTARDGRETPWRAGSKRLIVWFGDAPSHTESTTMAGAIAALNAEGITVLAFNNTSAGMAWTAATGCRPSRRTNQASTVAAATGGSLLNNFLSFRAGLRERRQRRDRVRDDDARPVFGSSYGGPGLAFSFM